MFHDVPISWRWLSASSGWWMHPSMWAFSACAFGPSVRAGEETRWMLWKLIRTHWNLVMAMSSLSFSTQGDGTKSFGLSHFHLFSLITYIYLYNLYTFHPSCLLLMPILVSWWSWCFTGAEPYQVVLIGDHAQLPATVLSKAAQNEGLGLSLFERMDPCQQLRDHSNRIYSRSFNDSIFI